MTSTNLNCTKFTVQNAKIRNCIDSVCSYIAQQEEILYDRHLMKLIRRNMTHKTDLKY